MSEIDGLFLVSSVFEKIPAPAKKSKSMFPQSLIFQKFVFQALHFYNQNGLTWVRFSFSVSFYILARIDSIDGEKSNCDPHEDTEDIDINHGRGSPPELFLGKGVLKTWTNLQENTHAKEWYDLL